MQRQQQEKIQKQEQQRIQMARHIEEQVMHLEGQGHPGMNPLSGMGSPVEGAPGT